ncbi:hypothetical protein CJF32_00001295 [Rutstroemia sp. NJR-2017a WRK4]|nr:hypothetical protein CJF32_00001295 [Rutstroemia sp. NJR-2017a WRK4]
MSASILPWTLTGALFLHLKYMRGKLLIQMRCGLKST